MSATPAREGLSIVIVGATGAVGADLVAALHRSSLPVRRLALFCSARGAVEQVEVDGGALPVTPLQPGALPPLEEVDVVIFATPAEVTRALAPLARAAGPVVLELGTALSDQAPLLVPAVGLHGLERFDALRLACCPGAATVALATLLGPLVERGLVGVSGLVMLSAGVAGREGVSELSSQVAALFNAGTPPRKVFPAGLAFDLLSPVDATPPALGGWSESEIRLAAEVGALVGLDPARIAVTEALVPVFAGVALSLHLRFEGELSLAELSQDLGEAQGVRLGDPVPGPRRLVGRAGLYVGRLRLDPLGDGVHCWAAADNLRFGASGNAIAVLSALLAEGRV